MTTGPQPHKEKDVRFMNYAKLSFSCNQLPTRHRGVDDIMTLIEFTSAKEM